MALWAKSDPINNYAGGDKTRQAISKFDDEFDSVYAILNELKTQTDVTLTLTRQTTAPSFSDVTSAFKYTMLGDMVFLTGAFNYDGATGGSGYWIITGMPHAALSGSISSGNVSICSNLIDVDGCYIDGSTIYLTYQNVKTIAAPVGSGLGALAVSILYMK